MLLLGCSQECASLPFVLRTNWVGRRGLSLLKSADGRFSFFLSLSILSPVLFSSLPISTPVKIVNPVHPIPDLNLGRV